MASLGRGAPTGRTGASPSANLASAPATWSDGKTLQNGDQFNGKTWDQAAWNWVSTPSSGGTLPPPVGAQVGGGVSGGTTAGSVKDPGPSPDTQSLAGLAGLTKGRDSSTSMLQGQGVALKNLGNRVPPSLQALLTGKAY